MDSGWPGGGNQSPGEFDYSSGVPTRRIQPLDQEPANHDEYSDPRLSPEEASLAVRLAIPGAFLIFAGIFNLLISSLFLFAGIALANENPEDILARMRQDNPQQAQMLEGQLAQANMTWERAISIYRTGFLVAGGLGIATGLLGIWGGRAMTRRQNHGMALAGALVTAIPCVTPMGCLMLGPIFGFWALIVLMREDSWLAFGR